MLNPAFTCPGGLSCPPLPAGCRCRDKRSGRWPLSEVLRRSGRPDSLLDQPATSGYLRHRRRAVQHTRPVVRRQAVLVQASTQSEVRLRLQHQVAFGEVIKVVGEPEALGAWDPHAAPALTWGEGDVWTGTLGLAPGSYTFKCVVVREDGSLVAWQPAENRTIEVPAQAGILEAEVHWSDPTVTAQLSMDEDESEPEQEDFPVEESAPPETGTAPAPDKAASTVPEEGEKLGEMVSVDEEDIEAARGDEVPDPTPASRQAAAEGSSNDSPQASATAPSGRHVEQEQHSKASSREPPWQQADYSSNAAPSGTPSIAGGSSALDEPGSGEGSTFPQWAALVLGGIAVPVVAWSEFTLKTTGCGLPPGPGGALGAAEGVSYLVLVGVAAWSLTSRLTKGRGLPPGPGGLLGAVEGLTYATILSGIVVLALQGKERGFVPSALPDARCYGEGNANMEAVAVLPEQMLRHAQLLAALDAARQDLTGGIQQVSSATAESAQAAADSATQVAKELQERLARDAAKSQGYMEETYAGAVDGISGADLSSVVEELAGAAGALGDALTRVRNSLTAVDLGPLLGKVQDAAAQVQAQVSSLAGGLPESLKGTRVAAVSGQLPLPSQSSLLLATIQLPAPRLFDSMLLQRPQAPVTIGTASTTTLKATALQMRNLAVQLNMALTAATTSAVSATNNVNNTLNTVIMQLQNTVDGVKTVVEDVAAAAQNDGVDLSKLSDSVADVQQTLGSAKATTSSVDLRPLIRQLQGAVNTLQANDHNAGVAALVSKLQTAVHKLEEAARTTSSDIVPALDTATEAVERIPGSDQPDLAPVLDNLQRVTQVLQQTLSKLTQAASSIKETSTIVPAGTASPAAPSAPTAADSELKQATADAASQDAVEPVTQAGPDADSGATAAQIAGVDTQTPDVPSPPVVGSASPNNPAP